ncbi:MAG: hypothetical protein AB8H79_26580 [Myxococcota bacterium]
MIAPPPLAAWPPASFCPPNAPMALPISSSPLPPDVAVHGWAALTVRVAWTLLALRVRPRPDVLRDARDHVLFHLDPNTPLTRAEDLAEHLTRGFVARAREQEFVDPWPQDIEMPLSSRWRLALDEHMRPLARTLFRQHYGYGRPLDPLANRLQLDRMALEEARGSLREMVRRVALADEVPLDNWSPERIDRLLARLASLSVHDSPPLDEVADGCHLDWVQQCPRCDRTLRLAKAGILSSEDLVPPAWAARPTDVVRVMAVHLHPDARARRTGIVREVGGHTQSLGDDLLLVDADDEARGTEVLVMAAELGAPARRHLRAVVLSGAGRWSRHGLLGPLADEARQKVGAQSWGIVEGHGELPDVLPPAPSSARWWSAVGLLVAAAIVLGVVALRPAPDDVDQPLDVSFTEGRGGIWTQFDTPERARLTLIRQVGGHLEVVCSGEDASEKGRFATGDGRYRVHTVADGVLVATSTEPIENLQDLVDEAVGAQDPLGDLAARIRSRDPGSAVAAHVR